MTLSHDYTITVRENMIVLEHAPDHVVSGQSLPPKWEAVGRACREHACHRILVLGSTLKYSANVADMYFTADLIAKMNIRNLRIAFALGQYATREIKEMFLFAAHNRGIQVQLFDDADAAHAWLLEAELQDGA